MVLIEGRTGATCAKRIFRSPTSGKSTTLNQMFFSQWCKLNGPESHFLRSKPHQQR
jgi:hypothetical protein